MSAPPRRVLILEAAGRLFRHYGPLKTTVADIAREASVGVGTVYLEFRNKDAILRDLSEGVHGRVLEAQRAAWESSDGDRAGVAAVLRARFEAFVSTGSDGPHGSDLLACGTCAAVERAHREFAKEELAQLGGWLVAIGVQDARQAASTLLIAQTAFAPPHVFAHPPQALRASLERLLTMLLEGLDVRGGLDEPDG